MKKDPKKIVSTRTKFRNFLQIYIYKNLILVWCYVLAQPMIITESILLVNLGIPRNSYYMYSYTYILVRTVELLMLCRHLATSHGKGTR